MTGDIFQMTPNEMNTMKCICIHVCLVLFAPSCIDNWKVRSSIVKCNGLALQVLYDLGLGICVDLV